MPSYKFSAIGSDGRTTTGKLDASSKAECVAELRRRNLTPLDIQEKSGGRGAPAPTATATLPEPKSSAPGASAAAPVPRPQRRVGGVKPGIRKREEIVIFTRQLATMIGAGIPMLESLEILKEQAESKQFSALLDGVIADVRAGQDFSTSIERY